LDHALQTEHSRLDRLKREDRAVRAAFDLSYQHLDHGHARLFRLLPLNPGPDLSTEAAARLADTDPSQAEGNLQDRARAHLIEPGQVWGRWRLHDLVRLYADQHGATYAGTDQRDSARARLFAYYQDTTQAAGAYLEFLPVLPSSTFPDRAAALAWLEDERGNLVATATAAPALGHPETSVAIAFGLAYFFDYRRLFDDLMTVTTTVLAVCRDLGDRSSEGAALGNLGLALDGVRRFDDAIHSLTQAVAACRDLGDRSSEGAALGNLEGSLLRVRRFGDAIDVYTQALAICSELGDHHREAAALTGLGDSLARVRRFDDAIDAHPQAVAAYREIGDRHGEGTGLNSLGLALREARRFDEAIDVHTEAVAAYRETGDLEGEGAALNSLGLALRQIHHFDEAADAYGLAATAFRSLGDRHREGQVLGASATTHNEGWLWQRRAEQPPSL
jgi:tetratricopeptide (TPR) repeat protein